MSYNYNNQYSPYYQADQSGSQQQSGGGQQNGGGQYSNDSRLAGNYSSSTYQPLSAYQSEHQRQMQQQQEQTQSTPPSNGYSSIGYTGNPSYSTASYGSLGATTTAEPNQISSYTTARPNAIGYTEEASGQARSNLAQLIDYNRARGTTSYGTASPLANASDNQSTQLGTQGNAAYPQTTQSPAYASNYRSTQGATGYSRQENNINSTGRSSPAQYQFSTPQQQSQSSRQTQYFSSLPRPNSGQALQRPASDASGNSNQSPQMSNAQQAQSGRAPNAASINQTTSSRGQSGQLPHGQQASQSSKAPVRSKNQSSQKQQTQKSQKAPKRPSNVNSLVNGVSSGQASPMESQMPTTVDPSQVFNNDEYRRRQSEAEAARKAAEAAKASKSNRTSLSSPGDDVTQAARALMGPTSPNADSATKVQIEQEMKAMIEKMRDYKAKDPSLFSQVWEEVKKGTPTQSGVGHNASKGSASSPIVNGRSMNQQTDLPAEAELPASSPSQESTFPQDYDRGRYPMQRRKRGNATFAPDRKVTKSGKNGGRKSGEVQGNSVEGQPSMNDTNSKTSKQSSEPVPDYIKAGIERANQALILYPPTTADNYAQQSLSMPKSTPQGGTFWPEHMKRALADAARNALLSSPFNAGKSITTDEIHEVLNSNPSYHQLCNHLEAKRFVIERASFARLLLSTVPEMDSNKTSAAQSAPASAPIPPQPPAYRPPVGYMPPLNAGAGSFSAPKQENSQSPAINGFPQTALSKQEKARKRDFAEIVDLSNLSDEDDIARYRPKPRPEMSHPKPGPLPGPGQSVDEKSNVGLEREWGKQWAERWGFQDLGAPQKTAQPPSKPIPKPQSGLYRNERESLLYDKVAEPLNERRDALRRSSYDVRTIARDILVSSGRHPTMGALNNHLDPLREQFVSIDQNTDLSTLRWDLIDPGGPPVQTQPRQAPESIESVGPGGVGSPHLAQSSTTRRPGRPGPRRSGGVAVATTAELAAQTTENKPQMPKKRGRPPKYRPSSIQPMGTSQQPGALYIHPVGELRPDSSTGQVPAPLTMTGGAQPTPDQRPPGVQAAPSSNPPSGQRPPASTIARTASSAAASNDQTPYGHPLSHQPSMMQFEASVRTATPSSATPGGGDRPTETPTRVPGRKGRPPGAKNKQPRSDKGVAKRQVPQGQTTQQPTSSHSPSNSNIIRETSIPLNSTPARQSGLRNVMTPGSGLAVVIPSHPSSAADLNLARKGSDGTKSADNPSGRYPAPSFKDLNCRWENCSAELQSMEVLRRHVFNSHRRGDGPWLCKWADCHDHDSERRDDELGGTDGQQRVRLRFGEKERWERHVERKHLGPYAREFGELGGADDLESSDYMSDSSHRRAVPRSHPPPSSSSPRIGAREGRRTPRTDPLPWNTDPKVAAEYHEAHHLDTEEERRKAVVRALTAKKKSVGGPGIYKIGGGRVGEGARRVLMMTGGGDGDEEEVREVEDERLESWMGVEEGGGVDGEGGGSEEDFEKV